MLTYFPGKGKARPFPYGKVDKILRRVREETMAVCVFVLWAPSPAPESPSASPSSSRCLVSEEKEMTFTRKDAISFGLL
ncbi:Hypothetical protein NTJ_02490 [Nesidiocoris tenuis]|uniref:Uncharacterized protein n=1 Tax=Nesidiocoris tenuis TaxID=355587 RepID=A0ABN7ABJ5_9HEMI|nr:Hypothetical protein NTJ_02490 [Nesidiocoris tenuis]